MNIFINIVLLLKHIYLATFIYNNVIYIKYYISNSIIKYNVKKQKFIYLNKNCEFNMDFLKIHKKIPTIK